jgi:hypothetical protein
MHFDSTRQVHSGCQAQSAQCGFVAFHKVFHLPDVGGRLGQARVQVEMTSR